MTTARLLLAGREAKNKTGFLPRAKGPEAGLGGLCSIAAFNGRGRVVWEGGKLVNVLSRLSK